MTTKKMMTTTKTNPPNTAASPHSESLVVSPPRSSWKLWLELLMVLALTAPLYGGHSVGGEIVRTYEFPTTPTHSICPASSQTRLLPQWFCQ